MSRIYIDSRFTNDPFVRAAAEQHHSGAEILPRRPARAFSTELTPIGEQFVMPGCEKQPQSDMPTQLDLWSGK